MTATLTTSAATALLLATFAAPAFAAATYQCEGDYSRASVLITVEGDKLSFENPELTVLTRSDDPSPAGFTAFAVGEPNYRQIVRVSDALLRGAAKADVTDTYGSTDELKCTRLSPTLLARWRTAADCAKPVTEKVAADLLADLVAGGAPDPQVGSDGGTEVRVDLKTGKAELYIYLSDVSDNASGEWPGHDVFLAVLKNARRGAETECRVDSVKLIETYM